MSSNLPPGITDNMIPGNMPEDEAWDNLHIEIDNDADANNLSHWDALDVWQLGLELWQKCKEQVIEADAQSEKSDKSENIPENIAIDDYHY